MDAQLVLVGRLRARRGEIEEMIFVRVSDRWFDRTGSDDPEYVAGLRAAGTAALDYVFAGVERWKGFLEPVPEEAIEQARRAARAGVGLETVLRRYSAGHAVLADFVIQEAEHAVGRGHHAALREILGIVATVADRLSAAVSIAYNKERRRVGGAACGAYDAPVRGLERGRDGAGRRIVAVHSGLRRDAVVEMRRERILRAMVELASERGFADTSVSLLASRAGVSASTFYAEFQGLQDCFLEVLDLGLKRAYELILQAYAREERWQDGVLGALASLLTFFEAEPQLTRVWFVDAMAAGSWALQRREAIVGQLRSVAIGYWVERGTEPPEPVAAMGVMASVLGLIQARLVNAEPGPLIELLGPLMGLITSLHLDKAEVAREVERGRRLAGSIQEGEVDRLLTMPVLPCTDAVLPALIANPAACRLRECVLFIAEHPGAANHEIAKALGISYQSQISKLLSSLSRAGLVVKQSGEHPGMRNAWRLTPQGEAAVRVLREQGEAQLHSPTG
jgi:AcrR family transcriptional regulator